MGTATVAVYAPALATRVNMLVAMSPLLTLAPGAGGKPLMRDELAER